MAPSPDELLLIGTITSSFGLKGQVKLHAVTDQIEHLRRKIRVVYAGADAVPYQLLHVIEHKPGVLLLSLQGVDTRDAADALRGTDIFIAEQEAVPLAADEYYLHQLYNLRVETSDGSVLGQVREVLETGANEVLVVTRPGQSDALIPMIHDVVQELDIAGGRIVINLLDGLLP